MNRTVIVSIKVDPDEYTDAVDTPEGTIALVRDMLRNEADLSEETITIECDGVEEPFLLDEDDKQSDENEED